MRLASVTQTVVLTVLAIVTSAHEQFPTMASVHGRMPCGSCNPPKAIPSRSIVAPTSEPGERLLISGDVYERDGVTRAPDTILFLFHTDASGRYNQPNDPLNPRLYGWVRTDQAGHYEFDTIKPAAYPNHSEPAHIHVHLFGTSHPERFIEEFRFADDPLLSSRDRALPHELGRFSPVVTLMKNADAACHGTRDLRLD
jgi:protocatechuate 3,4-dioxygenase beta subunit